jgi:hypothetical protein
MSEKRRIKKVLEYFQEGPPQFDVIQRREVGKTFNYKVLSTSDDLEFNYEETIQPPDNGLGIIWIVKRISDDQLFHQGDMIEVQEIGSCFVTEFKEDRIHCVVVGLFEQAPIEVEVNQLISVVDVVVGDYEDLEDEQ